MTQVDTQMCVKFTADSLLRHTETLKMNEWWTNRRKNSIAWTLYVRQSWSWNPLARGNGAAVREFCIFRELKYSLVIVIERSHPARSKEIWQNSNYGSNSLCIGRAELLIHARQSVQVWKTGRPVGNDIQPCQLQGSRPNGGAALFSG